jgi:tRNA-2-methylthio-N6-dimethylallyladenosine synthase
MNVADSRLMAEHLESLGMSLSLDRETSDVIVLNTCSVRYDAEHRALAFIGRLKPLKERNPEIRIIVAGCAAQRMGQELKRKFPFVDLVVGAREIDGFPETFNRAFPGFLKKNMPAEKVRLPSRGKESPAAAFVTLMRGCQNNCSYCIVPHVRGPEKSRPVAEVLGEIEACVRDGFKEILLLGQNVNSYNGTGENSRPVGFSELLKRVNDMDGVERIRFMTSHPKDLSDELIEAIASLPKVCEHLHLPLQSGSDTVLKAMNRKYSAADYLALVDKLRARVPGISVTTDVLIGFPGETEKDFQKTLDIIERVRFDSLFAFKYSPRPCTASFSLAQTVPEPEKEKRLQRVLATANGISTRKHAALAGTVQNVLVEKTDKGICTGRTRSNLKVFFKAPRGKDVTGAFVNITVTRTKINTLLGDVNGA